MLQSNQSKALFTRLLDEYIAHLGNVYEKKSNLLRFYRNVYVISSADDQNLSITPNEYLALVQTLENAAQQGDWGTTVNLSLPVIQADGSIVEKNLTLNEIKAAIQEIPLPASYYATALKVAAGVAVGAALIGGAYYTYNPQAFNFLQGKVAQAEQNLDTAAAPATDQAQPVEQNAAANIDAAQSSVTAAVEASDEQPAQTSMWDYLMGRGSGYNADKETIDFESFKDSDWHKPNKKNNKRNVKNTTNPPGFVDQTLNQNEQLSPYYKDIKSNISINPVPRKDDDDISHNIDQQEINTQEVIHNSVPSTAQNTQGYDSDDDNFYDAQQGPHDNPFNIFDIHSERYNEPERVNR